MPAHDFAAGVQYIRSKAQELKRDPNEISMAWGAGDLYNIIAEDEATVRSAARPLLEASKTDISLQPWIMGTPQQCKRKVTAYVEAGATNIVIGFPDFPSTQSLKLFTEQVLT